MNNESEILTTLQRILKLQEESHATQKQSYELQRKALENQSSAIKNQVATGRLYRIALAVGSLVIAGFIFLLTRLSY